MQQPKQPTNVCVWNAFGQYKCGAPAPSCPSGNVDATFASSTAGFAAYDREGEGRSLRPRELPRASPTGVYTVEGFYSAPEHEGTQAGDKKDGLRREGFCSGSCPAV